MCPRADLDGRKISSSSGFDPGPSSPCSVAIPTELPGPQCALLHTVIIICVVLYISVRWKCSLPPIVLNASLCDVKSACGDGNCLFWALAFVVASNYE